MKVENLCKSIYLGDRYCKNVEISNNKIVFQINLISRIREGTSEWNYYNDGDIRDGSIVFDQVTDYCIYNGSTINDEIEIRYLKNDNSIYHFVVEGAEYSNDNGSYNWVKFEISCCDFYLLDNNTIIRD